jgi:hypothetical protein
MTKIVYYAHPSVGRTRLLSYRRTVAYSSITDWLAASLAEVTRLFSLASHKNASADLSITVAAAISDQGTTLGRVRGIPSQ